MRTTCSSAGPRWRPRSDAGSCAHLKSGSQGGNIMNVRRVVTGKVGGKAKIISDGGTRRSRAFKNIPGQSAALIWSTAAAPAAPGDGADIISEKSNYVP